MNDNDIKKFIYNELSKFNFKRETKGFKYLCDAIFICIKDENALDNLSKNVFPQIAKKYNEKSFFKVKWCIEQVLKTMYNNTKISTLVGKGLQMSAGKLSDYLLGSLDGGKVKFIVNTLYKLAGDAYPSSSSSSKAKLSLTVSTNSTVVHIWRYVNDNYYMRTSTVKAKITETWGLRDVNGNHYYKTHVYTSYSNYYEDNAQALVVNSSQSYGIYQQYKAQGFLGIYFQKQEVSPFTAALPIHFAA